jgi:hypothetical protein
MSRQSMSRLSLPNRLSGPRCRSAARCHQTDVRQSRWTGRSPRNAEHRDRVHRRALRRYRQYRERRQSARRLPMCLDRQP